MGALPRSPTHNPCCVWWGYTLDWVGMGSPRIHAEHETVDRADEWKEYAACRPGGETVSFAAWMINIRRRKRNRGRQMDDRVPLVTHVSQVMYPLEEKSPDERFALAVCDVCPVRTECREWAIAYNEREGVWGGTTAKERRRIMRRRALAVKAQSDGQLSFT